MPISLRCSRYFAQDADGGNAANDSDVVARDKSERFRFEYHGWLHYGDRSSLLRPNSWDDTGYTAEQQIARMFECIKIAEIFLGSLMAFETAIQDDIRRQVRRLGRQMVGNRNSQRLHLLRMLALGVVNLTNFNLVTLTKEDQAYFRRFEHDAHIVQRQEWIVSACETVHNMQIINEEKLYNERQEMTNNILLVLAGLTLISVVNDAYSFIEHAASKWGVFGRLVVVAAIITCVVGIGVLLGRPHRRRWCRRRLKRLFGATVALRDSLLGR